MALGILGEQFAGRIEVSVLANAGENIQHLASICLGISDTVRGEEWQVICARKVDQLAIDAFLAANEMPLDFHENIFAAKGMDQKLGAVRGILGSARLQRAGDSESFRESRTFGALQTCRSSFRQNA